MEGTVVCRLREARRYLVFQQFLEYTVWGLFASLLVLAVSAAVSTKILPSELCWLAAVGCPIALAGLGRFAGDFSSVLREARYSRESQRSLCQRARFTRSKCCTWMQLVESGWVRRKPPCPRVSSTKIPQYFLAVTAAAALGSGEGFYIWHSNELASELTSAQKLLEEARSAAELEAKKEEEFEPLSSSSKRHKESWTDSREPLREALRGLG